MLKKKLALVFLLFSLFNLNAQETSNITLRITPGVLINSHSENLGLFLHVEPKIKISENAVIGLRFGLILNSQKFEINESSPFNINKEHDNAVVSFVPTYDYYLNKNNIRPYVGLGIGYYLVSEIPIANPSQGVSDGNVNNQIGGLLRTGVELGKIRFEIEYNFIPKADIEIPNNQIIGTVDNSYLGLSIGFTIGGRKYEKQPQN